MPTFTVLHVGACEQCPFHLRRGHQRRWCLHPVWRRATDQHPSHTTTIVDGGAKVADRDLPQPPWCPLRRDTVTVTHAEEIHEA